MTFKPKKSWLPVMFVVIPLAFAVFVYLGGHVVRLLWNWLLPELFGWPTITVWQALGLLALCRILFGGFTFRDSHRGDQRWGRKDGAGARHDDPGEPMSADERERLRQGMRERWGGTAEPGRSDAAPGA